MPITAPTQCPICGTELAVPVQINITTSGTNFVSIDVTAEVTDEGIELIAAHAREHYETPAERAPIPCLDDRIAARRAERETP